MQAGADYWNAYFRELLRAGDDLDWKGRWTDAFSPYLQNAEAADILEIGCGTGHDAARLAREGYRVTAVDVSSEAIGSARDRYGRLGVTFCEVDVADGLPFADESFDAVMANVALHLFPDAVTRTVVGDIRRVVRRGGLLLAHVNAAGDRALRAVRRPVVREIEPNYVLEASGQTVRFFSREYLLDVLSAWDLLALTHVEIPDAETGEPFKCVWRLVARRPSGRSANRLTNPRDD